MAPPGGSQTGPHALPSLALPNSVTLIHNGGNLACCQISKVGHSPAVRPVETYTNVSFTTEDAEITAL